MIRLNGRDFSRVHPCVIGEVAQAHDGSLGFAHAFIDSIADAGADAVKFQTHIAEAESTPAEPWRIEFSRQDASRYEYWKRMEFTEEQWHGLKRHADERRILFLSSSFSTQAAELLERVGVAAWKVASGEMSNTILFDRMLVSGLPLLLSSGMSTIEEIDASVERIHAAGLPFAVMQCTSSYPCPPEKVGLNMLRILTERYHCPVGLSDHSGTIFPALAAATLGAEILEVHVTFSREMFGPDVTSSVTTSELRQLIEGVRFIEKMNANPIQKDDMAKQMKPLRDLFMKSIVVVQDLPAGAVLLREHLTVKKPGTGISPNRIESVLGCQLRRPVRANQVLVEQDLVEWSVNETA